MALASTTSPRPPKPGWGLKRKLIMSMLLVGMVPLLLGLAMAFWQGSREIQEVSGESFKALATETARKLDLVVGEEIARTARIARDPLLVSVLEKHRDSLSEQTSEARQAALESDRAQWDRKEQTFVTSLTENKLALLLRQYFSGSKGDPDESLPEVVRSATKALFVTDIEGRLAASITSSIDYSHADTVWWQGAWNKGVGRSSYIEDLHFDQRLGAYVFTLSLPVMDSLRYEAIGVVHRVIDAKEFFAPATNPIRFGKTGHVMLIDSRGIVLSCPILPTGVRLSDPRVIPQVTVPYPGWAIAPSDGHGGQATSIIGFGPLPETSRATNGSIESAWHTFVWQSSDELFGPVEHLLTWMSVFGFVAVGLLATLGYLAASRIVTPVRHLQAAAQSIGRGELREPIQIKTGDELEELAEEFNRMNAQLEVAFAGLTDQVKLKTQEVQYLQQSTDQILDAVPTPIVMIDQQERVQYVNQASKEAFTLSDATLVGHPISTLLQIDPSSLTRLREEFQQSTASDRTQYDRIGGSKPVNEARDPLAPMVSHLEPRTRRNIQIGDRLYHYQWFRLDGRGGEHERIGLVLRDTTDESRMQDQLIQAEKSGSLGVLTAGIGHELNNPLFGILGLGEAIQEESDLTRVKAFARDIVEHGRRMAAIIRDFAGIATREAKDQRVIVDVNSQLDQALATVHAAHDTHALRVQKHYATVSPVSALPDQLRHAFVNIITNAVQATQGKGNLTIRTGESHGLVSITIQDSGPGIPKQHLTKVFDPFFTTKGQGEGSGLGLTVAQRIVRKFGGDIRMESNEGHGTSCVITLPPAGASVRKEESCPLP